MRLILANSLCDKELALFTIQILSNKNLNNLQIWA